MDITLDRHYSSPSSRTKREIPCLGVVQEISLFVRDDVRMKKVLYHNYDTGLFFINKFFN